jgi:hypothetical protein
MELEILVSDKLNTLLNAYLKGSVENQVVSLSISADQIPLIHVNGSNYFDCLCQIREVLEKQNLFLLCQGAVKNVYPSGMSISMGLGVMAYRLEMGMQAQRSTLVNIFDSATADDVCTVVEQRSFFDSWRKSKKSNTVN